MLIRGGTNTRPTPDTSGYRGEIPDPIERQGPDIKENWSFHINSAIFFVSSVFTVPEFWKLLPDQFIGYNSAYSLKKAKNIESLLDKPDPDPALISAYVPDLTHIFSVRSTRNARHLSISIS